jgi:hypothetical protein
MSAEQVLKSLPDDRRKKLEAMIADYRENGYAKVKGP